MPPRKVSAAQLPALELTTEDKHALRALANDLEAEVVQVYEEFVFAHHHQVDSLRWKQIKSQQDLSVFCERDVAMRSINRLQPFFPSGRAPARHELGPQGLLAASCKSPIKMATGTVPGTLDDALYGGSVHDTASLHLRSEYQKEVMHDSAVLSVIDEATDEDPYRFLGVVWYLKTVGLPGVSDRDMLMLSQSRTSRLSNGERIGVHLYHSIMHEDLPELTDRGVLRINVSLVIIFRQLSEHTVDVFMLDVVDAKGSTPTIVNTQESAKTLLASGNICATGVKKKLHWCMREKQRKRSLSRLVPLGPDESNKKTCYVCTKTCGGFFHSSSSLCHLCRQRTCSKCSISKDIIMTATESEIETKAFDFCRLCFMEAKNRPTIAIARAELYERRMLRERACSDRPASDAGTVMSNPQ